MEYIDCEDILCEGLLYFIGILILGFNFYKCYVCIYVGMYLCLYVCILIIIERMVCLFMYFVNVGR